MSDNPAPKKKKKKKKRQRAAGTIEEGAIVSELASKTPGKDLGIDRVAKKEDRTLRKAGKKGHRVETKDAFEQKADRSAEDVDKKADALEVGGAGRKLRQLTGNVAGASSESPQVGALGLIPTQKPAAPTTEPSVEAEREALPGGEAVVAALRDRVKAFKRHYGFQARWRCPHPGVLGNSAPDQNGVPGSHDQPKDANLCLDVLYQAGFAVPLAPVESVEAEEDGGMWYPLAVELPEFSRGRERCFNLVAIQRLQGMASKQRRIRIAKALGESQPGDLVVGIFVDEDGQPYGLCWVVAENQVEQAQVLVAGHCDDAGAMIARFPLDHFLWAETLQVLRAMRARGDGSPVAEKLVAPPKVFS